MRSVLELGAGHSWRSLFDRRGGNSEFNAGSSRIREPPPPPIVLFGRLIRVFWSGDIHGTGGLTVKLIGSTSGPKANGEEDRGMRSFAFCIRSIDDD